MAGLLNTGLTWRAIVRKYGKAVHHEHDETSSFWVRAQPSMASHDYAQ